MLLTFARLGLIKNVSQLSPLHTIKTLSSSIANESSPLSFNTFAASASSGFDDMSDSLLIVSSISDRRRRRVSSLENTCSETGTVGNVFSSTSTSAALESACVTSTSVGTSTAVAGNSSGKRFLLTLLYAFVHLEHRSFVTSPF